MMAFDLNMDKHKKVHFIGIGGVSMSGLAAVLLTKGYKFLVLILKNLKF